MSPGSSLRQGVVTELVPIIFGSYPKNCPMVRRGVPPSRLTEDGSPYQIREQSIGQPPVSLRRLLGGRRRLIFPRHVIPTEEHFIERLITPVDGFRGIGIGRIAARIVPTAAVWFD